VILIQNGALVARYVVGDIQGFYQKLQEALAIIQFNPSVDTLYVAGDMVNRGPQSLETLKWMYKNQDSVIAVLGNHDIYLLARYHRVMNSDSEDTLDSLLKNKHVDKYVDWLKTCGLMFMDGDSIIVHAGLHPHISLNDALRINHQVVNNLRGKDCISYIKRIYSNGPALYPDELEQFARQKFFINSATRMRVLNTKDLSMDYRYKGPPHFSSYDKTIPWFLLPKHHSVNKRIYFGHWAALGYYHDNNVTALDTGCGWGSKLTVVNMDTYEAFHV